MNRNRQGADADDAVLVAQAIEELPYVTRAYEILVRRHYRLIYRTCLHILKDPSEAEDATQLILLKVFNGLPRFHARSTFKTWLVKIVTNTCFTRFQQLKQRRQRYTKLEESSLEQLNTDSGDSPEFLWLDNFETMVCCLNEQEKKIVSLRFVSELSLPEIAVVMEMKLSATKMRFYRALKKLKKQL